MFLERQDGFPYEKAMLATITDFECHTKNYIQPLTWFGILGLGVTHCSSAKGTGND